MIYKNALITTKDEQFLGYLEVDDSGVIQKIEQGLTTLEGFDCQKQILMPSFIDSHTHGGYGFSFDHVDQIDWYKKYLVYEQNLNKEGVGFVLATTVTQSFDKIQNLAVAYKKILDENKTNFLTWYLEGPFLSKAKKGAHNSELIIPLEQKHLDFLKSLNFKQKLIVTVAPEESNNLAVVKKNSDDFIFALGHSNCQNAASDGLFNDVFKRIVHLYNAMSTFDHRKENLVNAVLQTQKFSDDFNVELISDGNHVNPNTVNFTYKNIDKNNLVVVSDCLAQKGLKNGNYFLDELAICKQDYLFYLADKSGIAGSAMPYNLVLKTFKKATKCSWSELVLFSSYNVAKQLKMEDKLGVLKTQIKANFILINEDFEVKLIYRNGVCFINQ